MSGDTLLLLFPDPADDALAECLRIGVGLLAGGHAVRIWSEAPLDPPGEAARSLEVLEEEEVAIVVADRAALRRALTRTSTLVRLAPATRSGTPEVLVADDAWLAAVDDDTLVATLREAGQVVRGDGARTQK